MGPCKPLSALAADILALLYKRNMPTDMLPLLIHTKKECAEIEVALAELQARNLVEPRPRVSPPHWQPVGA